jgi:hypothetical protein
MNAVEEPETRRAPAVRELLASPDFLRLWLVGAFANAMRWLELLVSGLFAYEATGSALAATAIVALRQLPQLLFGAFAGAVSRRSTAADRDAGWSCRRWSRRLATLATTGPLAVAWRWATCSGTMWANRDVDADAGLAKRRDHTALCRRSRSIGDLGRHPVIGSLLGGFASSGST